MAEIFNFYVQDNRSIQFPKANLLEPIMQEDHNVAVWRFRIPKVLNQIDMSDWAWWFVYVNAKGQKFTELLTLVDDIDEPDEYCTADYSIDYGVSYNPGSFAFSLESVNADVTGAILQEWHTKTYHKDVDRTLQGNQAKWSETESDIISALIVTVQDRVSQLVGGATPEPVSLIADMTDTSKVYLYVGSETGESTNYWYYYNGSAWVAGGLYASGIVVDSIPTQGSNNTVRSGGVYEALQNIDVSTDTTLSIQGKPADAKAVGDALADKVNAVSGKGLSTNDYSNAEKQKVTDATADLSAMTTATAEDVGKALKAKTVTDGKVIEWEFGEAGGSDAESETAATTEYLANAFCTFTPVSIYNTGLNVRINPETGLYYTDNTCKTVIFAVTEGDTIKATCGLNMQFQTGANRPTSGSPNRVGETYGSGTYYIEVPATAKYMAISTETAEEIAEVYVVQNLSGDIERAADYLDENEVIIESRLDMSTKVDSETDTQLVNGGQYQLINAGSYQEYRNVRIDFSKNGTYCINPIGTTATAVALKLYDDEDNLLTFNSGSSNSFEMSGLQIIEKIDSTTIVRKVYTSVDAIKKNNARDVYTYTYSGTISYAVIGNFRMYDGTTSHGVTYNKVTNVYIPYGKNITYSDELIGGVWNGFLDEDKFYNIPAGQLNPWMQRSHAKSNNLLDDRKIEWSPDNAQYLYLKNGETIPVEGGRTIMCNKGLDAVKWIDSEGTVTVLGNKGGNTPIELPAAAVAITFQRVWASNMPNGYEPVYIYYVDTLYPYDDANRNPVPMAQINGWDINSNIYDQCIPETTALIVRMMKTFSVREINNRQNALRLGTFNVYVQNAQTNKETVKKELETYGLDICCFQESQSLTDGKRYNLGDYLKGWQFKYSNTDPEGVTNPRQIASDIEIASSEIFEIGTGTNTCLKCIMNMPRYKDYADGLTTLSVYTYHGIVSSASERTAEVSDIIAKIAEDTSDFIVVAGDTNDFSENKDCWAQFQNAGLTPVHDGKSETVTDRNNSIDNIFISSNITCEYYNVINSSEWMYKPTPTANPIPVSDHDLLFADLQFDFEAVINARNNG